ncbi:MAG: phosphoethanolamine transferase [Tannerella sp.]|jgi:glucan phosphoethanolaminetransferase (alkaline phosphatase superfamily)|nr:phosphoethanolamine transferase [Tannerella sp.]
MELYIKKTEKQKKDFVWIIVLSIIALAPNIFLALYGNETILKSLLLFGISVIFYFLPAFFMKKRVFFILQGAFVLLAPFEMAHIYLNQTPATSAFLLSIINTNHNESFEMLLTLKTPLIILLLVWTCYFYITFVKINNSCFFKLNITKRLAAIFLFIGIITAGYATNYSRKVYPYDILFRINQAFTTKREIAKGKGKIEYFKFNAIKKDACNEKEIYVFVIGETGRYYNYSINGYERNTSPLLAEICNFISYSDFYSEANITSSSLQLILTRASAHNFKQSYVERSFVDAFREAGFKTYWIAAQSANNKFIRRISKDTDKEYFSIRSDSDENHYDEQLFPFLDSVLAKNNDKTLIIIHTLGSHFRYNYRYPAEFEVFKPSLKGVFDYDLISSKNKSLFVNTYDNSILYIDYFLSETIRKIDSLQQISAFMYVADHGENLFDTEQKIVFHGGSHYTKYDFHVPFFVWISDKYIVQYPRKAECIRNNRHRKLSASNIFYSILDIAGIGFPGQMLSKSIASESLQEDSVRYIINTNMEVKKGF